MKKQKVKHLTKYHTGLNKDQIESKQVNITKQDNRVNEIQINSSKHNPGNLRNRWQDVILGDLAYDPTNYFTYDIEYEPKQLYYPIVNFDDIVVPYEIAFCDLKNREELIKEFNLNENDEDDNLRLSMFSHKTHEKEIIEEVRNFIGIRLSDDIIITLRFLEYHLHIYFKNNGVKRPFLYNLLEILPTYQEISDARKKNIIAWVEEKLAEIKTEAKATESKKIVEISDLPDKKFKLPQQILLLERLGIIKYLDKFKLTAEKKAILISKFIGKDPQNTRKFLGTVGQPNNKNTCNTKGNNDLIDHVYTELGIH